MFFRRLSALFIGRLVWASVPLGCWLFAHWHCISKLLDSDILVRSLGSALPMPYILLRCTGRCIGPCGFAS
jgi:hypothetical protein